MSGNVTVSTARNFIPKKLFRMKKRSIKQRLKKFNAKKIRHRFR